MRLSAQQFAGRESYRAASAILLLLSFVFPLALAFAGVSSLVSFAIGFPACIVLVVVTFHRLRDASISAGWLIPMIVIINVGPFWQGPDSTRVYLSSVIAFLIPVAIGWWAPSRSGATPARAG